MLSKETLNRMELEDLRSYIYKINDVKEACGDLVAAKDELIGSLQRAYDNSTRVTNRLICYETKYEALKEVEQTYINKYK